MRENTLKQKMYLKKGDTLCDLVYIKLKPHIKLIIDD